MGFSLKSFFEELEYTLALEMKAGKTVKELAKIIADAKKYADECGQLN